MDTPSQKFTELGKGTYILYLNLSAPTELEIGKLGTFHLAAGWLAYVGSAFGPGGLRGRLNHHLGPVTRPHWHIDYLRRAASIHEIWVSVNNTRLEHDWAAVLQNTTGASLPVPRFGASDCTCPSHLFHFENLPLLDDLMPLLGEGVRRWIPAY